MKQLSKLMLAAVASVALAAPVFAWDFSASGSATANFNITTVKANADANALTGGGVSSDGGAITLSSSNTDGANSSTLSYAVNWADDGLDEKLLLRSDGTSVYMTQDLGTAKQRIEDFPEIGGMVYTVGNEQDYHFQVLFNILKKIGYDWANNLFHLSYGMVDLPTGKMKSREGKVIDADDLILQLIDSVKETSQNLGKFQNENNRITEDTYRKIALGALKYFILKVDPKKRILFNPKESIDLSGNTGPFIQYTYARIQSILNKVEQVETNNISEYKLNKKEKETIKCINKYKDIIKVAEDELSPAIICNYLYDLVKTFNSLYQNHNILNAETPQSTSIRLQISLLTSKVIVNITDLLGIELPDKM